MKKVEAACPSCGGPVEFKVSASLVTVCPACETIVARADRRLEDHGKVAALTDTNSPFHIGQSGRYREHPFEIVGHIQYQHPAGGVWDEWYCTFPNGTWGWIAEAQGKRYFTVQRDITHHMQIPAWPDLSVGQTVSLGSDQQFSVAEFNTATVRSFAGELPRDVRSGQEHRFADLLGPKSGFATIAYGKDEIELFRGREVSLEDLGVSLPAASDQESREISGHALSCPQCGGSLELRAPDAVQRVTCPFCSSLLDVNAGSLKYLETLSLQIKPRIPIGSEGTLRGVKFTVIGFLVRAVRFDREYTWEEFLLYEPSVGFRWLVHSDYHWNFVEPLGEQTFKSDTRIQYNRETYRIFQRAWARVNYVLGEFYWKVAIGDLVFAEDYIAPPRMLSLEFTPEGSVSDFVRERNLSEGVRFVEQLASLATYLPHQEVEKAFGIPRLTRGASIAPNQPPLDLRSVYWTWPLVIAILVALDVIISSLVSYPVEHGFTWVAAFAASIYPVVLWLFSLGMESSRWSDSWFKPDGSRWTDDE